MIQGLKIKIKSHLDNGIFHDSRADVNTLSTALQQTIDKLNEVIANTNHIIAKIKEGDSK